MGKTCSTRVLQWINNLNEAQQNEVEPRRLLCHYIPEGCLSTEVPRHCMS